MEKERRQRGLTTNRSTEEESDLHVSRKQHDHDVADDEAERARGERWSFKRPILEIAQKIQHEPWGKRRALKYASKIRAEGESYKMPIDEAVVYAAEEFGAMWKTVVSTAEAGRMPDFGPFIERGCSQETINELLDMALNQRN